MELAPNMEMKQSGAAATANAVKAAAMQHRLRARQFEETQRPGPLPEK